MMGEIVGISRFFYLIIFKMKSSTRKLLGASLVLFTLSVDYALLCFQIFKSWFGQIYEPFKHKLLAHAS